MEGNDDSDIIEHHVEEDTEKKDTRGHAATSSFLDSVTPSDRDAHSGTQSSHRLLAYSDALISIIATVMVMCRGVSGNLGLCLLLQNQHKADYFHKHFPVNISWKKVVKYKHKGRLLPNNVMSSQILPVAHTKVEDTEVNCNKVCIRDKMHS